MSRRSSRVYLRKAFGWLRDAWLIVGVTPLLLVGLDVLYRSALAVFRPLLPQLFAASRGVEDPMSGESWYHGWEMRRNSVMQNVLCV